MQVPQQLSHAHLLKDATEAISEAKAKHTQTCALIRRRCNGGERVDVAGLPPALRGPGGRADRDRRPALRYRQPAGRPGQSCETNQDETLPFVF